MKEQPQTITEVTSKYIMKASLQESSLFVEVKTLHSFPVKYLQLTLKNDSLSQDINSVFGDIQTIFYCLFNKDTYDVQPDQSRVLIKMPEELVHNPADKKVCALRMNEVKKDPEEMMSSVVRDLVSELQVTKEMHNKEVSEIKQFFAKKIKKERTSIEKLSYQHKKMKKLVKQMNKMIRQMARMRRRINGLEEDGPEPALLSDSDQAPVNNTEPNTSDVAWTIATNSTTIPLDPTQPNLLKYSINQNCIRYECSEQRFTQLIIGKKIQVGRQHKFSLRITMTKERRIMIGVVSRARRESKSSFDSGEAICYYGYNAWICHGRNPNDYFLRGNGFSVGETVTTMVDLQKGIIEWEVDRRIMASYKHDILRDHSKEFVPYLEMHDRGDSVRWLSG